jgi:hypothetical protein
MLGSTFASIPDLQLDPNNTLVYMNTKLGQSWYGPMEKDDFLLCEYGKRACVRVRMQVESGMRLVRVNLHK